MVLTVVAVVLGLHLAGELILAELNRREVRRHAGAAPAAVAAIVDAPTYAKSVEYTQAKLRFGMVSQVQGPGRGPNSPYHRQRSTLRQTIERVENSRTFDLTRA